MSAQQYDNTNRAVLFKNEDKRDERDPDYRGQANASGQEFWLDAWIQTAKKDGKKFMSLRLKPKQAQEHQGGAKNPPAQKAAEPDFNDDIPFAWAFALPIAGLLAALIAAAPVIA